MKYKEGFTIIELVVVIAVFLLIIGSAITIFISIAQNQRRVLAEQELLNQTSYAIENMSKALRMAKIADAGKQSDIECVGQAGTDYVLTRSNGGGYYRGIKFINASDNDACYEFFLDDDNILKELKNNLIDSSAVPLISDKFEINSIRFGIDGHNGCYGTVDICPDGASLGSGYQPRVTIALDIKVKGSEDSPSQKIQTTISQRNLNAQ